MLDKNLQLIPVTDVDYKALPIMPTPEEFFLLSRITGPLTVSQICQVSGVGESATLEALDRLLKAGLLRRDDGAPPDPEFGAEPSEISEAMLAEGFSDIEEESEPIAADDTLSGSMDAADVDRAVENLQDYTPTQTPLQGSPQIEPPHVEASSPKEASEEELQAFTYYPVAFDTFAFDADRLAESVAIGERRRREILFIAAHLDQVDYYALLNVPRGADRKMIRSAYFSLSKQFHPDLYFGKDVGSYEGDIESIFQHLNKAYQTLSNKNKRAEYDKTLPGLEEEEDDFLDAFTPSAELSAPGNGAPSPAASGPSTAPAAPPSDLSARDAKKRDMAFSVLLKRGEKREAGGEYGEAIEEYKKAFALKHDAMVALRAAGLLMRRGEAGAQEEALTLVRAATRENPGHLELLIRTGDILEEMDRLEEALESYRQAHAIDPTNSKVERRLEYLDNILI